MTDSVGPAIGPVVGDQLEEIHPVELAQFGLGSVIDPTPLQPSPRHTAVTGSSVWFKREDLQAVRSYKVRGAFHMISSLPADQRELGVVCASAGNHAQGVAVACTGLGVRGRIYVPRTTPRQKRDRIRALGGDHVELVVAGDTYETSAELARDDAARTGRVLVPAFDHPDVIAGQGTVIVEIVDQLGHAPDTLIVPVGGGGLLAGCLSWLAERHPTTRVIAVEPVGAASLSAAVAAGHPVTLDRLDTFVDGAAVRRIGDHTFAAITAYPGSLEVVQVDPGLVCEEMIDLFQIEGIIAEPAGALTPAALRPARPDAPGADTVPGAIVGPDVVCVISGGNHDLSRYAEIAERALISAGRKHYFLVEFPQEPGALRRFLDEVLGPDDDITLFEYVKRTNREFGPALVGIELGDAGDLTGLLHRLELSPVQATRIGPDDPSFRFLL